MSNQNVELVKTILPGEVDMVEVLASVNPIAALGVPPNAVSPDLEVLFAAPRTGGPGLSYHGIDGFAEGWRDWLSPWQSYRIELEEVIDVGDQVLSLVRVKARTSRHGVEVEHRPAAIWTVMDGKVVAMRFFLEQSEAFEYLGLAHDN
jgi:hypothetical protein